MAEEQNQLNDALSNATKAISELGNAQIEIISKSVSAFGSLYGSIFNVGADFVKTVSTTMTETLNKPSTSAE